MIRQALIRAAQSHDVWFDHGQGRPALLLDEVPVFLPKARRDGECPLSLRRETRDRVAAFKAAVISALRPAIPPGVSDRHIRHYERLLSSEGSTLNHKQAETTGALALAWTLQDIEEACQRPPLSHLEASFRRWLEQQVVRDGAIIVTERQAKSGIEDIAGHEVTLRAVRRLAIASGSRRIHARRARLLIRP